MCGICGFAAVDPRKPVSRAVIEAMTAALEHRGPDGCGTFVSEGIGLGVCRLAIIDLETGDQPITSESGSVTVVCNGEIYNGPELRRELEGAGHHLRTRSDVEPIVHLYEDLGLDFVSRLRGMFGLALWDADSRRLVLARDRLGIKPVVYSETSLGLWFGSEGKAILASGQVGRAADVEGIRDICTFGFVLTPRTLFAAIRRLPPAHLLVWHEGEATLRRYWQPLLDADDPGWSEQEWAEALLAKLEETVRLHLRSDVEVGAWLSPGVDSSGVVSLARRVLGRPPRTVTLAFADPLTDETRRSPTLDSYPGHELPNERATCDAQSFELFPLAVWHMEEPSAYALEIPRLLLARASARHVKVVLTGEGADEVFGGYPSFRWNEWTAAFARVPRWLRRGLLSGRALEAKHPWLVPLLLAPAEMGPERYARLIGMVPRREAMRVLATELRERLNACRYSSGWWLSTNPLGARSQFGALRLCELQVRLPDYVVHTLDRAAMAYGLEARVPFLDHELVELAAGIPPSLLLRRGTEKYILRRALAGSLPAEVCWRRKRGLAAPSVRWWREALPPFAQEMLSESCLKENGYFDPAAVTAMLERHREGQADLGRVLNAVLGVQVWHELFVRGRSLACVA
ncbi:MAG: asparagine synthase (glutamine-hydrolyzing) [Thermoanaerobaculales bacterium]